MDKEQRITLINSQIAVATITAMGMQAKNKEREAKGLSLAYIEADFVELIGAHQLGSNDVTAFLMGDY